MKVKIFSLNKYKSNMIVQNMPDYIPPWAVDSNGREIRNGHIVDTGFITVTEWESYVDEKYVRR